MAFLIQDGAMAINRNQVAKVHIPEPTLTWAPTPHVALLEMVEGALEECGMQVAREVYELAHDGNRFFGLLEIHRGDAKRSSAWIVGVRNSYEHSFGASVVAGARVLVSDNLSFSGEVKLKLDYAAGNMGEPMSGIVRLLQKHWLRHEHRISLYRAFALNDAAAHDLVIRAVDAEVCPNRIIPAVLAHWRVPTHDAFKARTAWSLFNAFIEALKGNLFDLPDRTERLHRLFDARVGIKTYPKGKDGG